MKRIAGGVAIASSALAVAAFGVHRATDAGAAGRCPTNDFCVYEHTNGGGRMANFNAGGGSPDLGRQGLHDAVSSLENRTNQLWCYYRDTNYRAQIGFVDGRTAGPINLRGSASDQISSVRAC